MKHTIFILVLAFTLTTLANSKSNFKGNGGMNLVCGPAQEIQLLDFYEATELHKFVLTNWDTRFTDHNIFQAVKNLLSQKLPIAANKLQQDYNYFNLNSRIVDGELARTDDSRHVFIPPECSLVQAAWQRQEFVSGEIKFLLSKSQWEKMSSVQRAGLTLHEILYMNSDQRDSRGVRRLVGFLMSQQINQASPAQVKEEFNHAGWVGSL